MLIYSFFMINIPMLNFHKLVYETLNSCWWYSCPLWSFEPLYGSGNALYVKVTLTIQS